MSDSITENLIMYLEAWKNKFNNHQMMFTGCDPYLCETEGYAKDRNLSLAHSGCCADIAECKESGFTYPLMIEELIVDTDPKVIKEVLEKVQKHFDGKFYIFFATKEITISEDGYEKHSYVFEEPENDKWIEDILYRVALGRMHELGYENYHNIFKEGLIRYEWSYNVDGEKFLSHSSPNTYPPQPNLTDVLLTKAVESVTRSIWLRSYFDMFSERVEMLHFQVQDCINDYCDATYIMKPGGISYICHCPNEIIQEAEAVPKVTTDFYQSLINSAEMMAERTTNPETIQMLEKSIERQKQSIPIVNL